VFLRTHQQSIWLGLPARLLAIVCVAAVTFAGLHLAAPAPSSGVEQAARTVSAAQGFADAAVAAFTDSAVGSDPTLTVEQRGAGIPAQPVAGLTTPTAAGPV